VIVFTVFPTNEGREREIKMRSMNLTAAAVAISVVAFGPSLISGSPITSLDSGMGGAGRAFGPSADTLATVNHAFQLSCIPDPDDALLIKFERNGEKHSFQLENSITTSCLYDPNIDPENPTSQYITLSMSGTGKLDRQYNATVSATFTDAGEPGRNDSLSLIITSPEAGVVFTFEGRLQGGNHQAR
jgi:hypothetical protein